MWLLSAGRSTLAAAHIFFDSGAPAPYLVRNLEPASGPLPSLARIHEPSDPNFL